MIQKHERDAIVDEIHETRQRIADRFGGDLGAMLADARERQAASGRPVWKGKPKDNAKSRSRGTGDVVK